MFTQTSSVSKLTAYMRQVLSRPRLSDLYRSLNAGTPNTRTLNAPDAIVRLIYNTTGRISKVLDDLALAECVLKANPIACCFCTLQR